MKNKYDLRPQPNNPKQPSKQQTTIPKITKVNEDVGKNKQNKKANETRITIGEKENEKVKEQPNPNNNVFNLTNELNKIKVSNPFNEIVKIPTFKMIWRIS